MCDLLGLKGKAWCALRDVEGNMSFRNSVHEHSDLNETPGWECGRHEEGNTNAWLVVQ